MEENRDMERYVQMPVFKAILENAVPAMTAMVMVLIYNLADTFFIGRTNDPFQVAAISMCTPIFMLSVTIGTIFGIGGTSLIARTLGEGNPQKAKKICSFCFYGGTACGLLLMLVILLFSKGLLTLMGAANLTFAHARKYLMIVAVSCPFAVISHTFSSVVRSEGKSKDAMTGQIIGNLINVVLDPVFIFAFKMGVAGAAVATIIGNVFAAAYYIRFFVSGKSSLSIRVRDFAMNDGIAAGVLSVGVSAALGSFLMTVSQILANKLIMDYGDCAVAGFGVAGKIEMIAGTLCVGLGQGVQALMGYCVGSRNRKRFKELVSTSLLFSLALGMVLSAIVILLRKPIVLAFLQEPETVSYAVPFTAILLSTGTLFGLFYVLTSILQAMGKGLAALIVNLSRQGIAFIPALYIMRAFFGLNGLIWAQPVADAVAVLCGLVICFFVIRKFMKEEA